MTEDPPPGNCRGFELSLCGLARRALASSQCRHVPICADGPRAAAKPRLEADRRDKVYEHRLGVVKTPVIDGEPSAAMLGINFDETLAELNIAPGVILLRLNRRCE